MSPDSGLSRLEQVIRKKGPEAFSRGDAANAETAAQDASPMLDRRQDDPLPFGEDYTDQIKVGLIGMLGGAILAAAIAGGLWYANIQVAVQPPAPSDAEYYRGVYDICMYTQHDANTCLALSASTAERDWYGQSSPGWDWPLPESESRASDTD